MTKTNKKYNFSNIMKTAWEIKRSTGCSLSTAMKQAWIIAKKVEYIAPRREESKKTYLAPGFTPISKAAKKTLNLLLEGVYINNPGDSKNIDNSDGVYMPVSIDVLFNNMVAVAHYGEQNGDLMADPEIVYWFNGGECYPVNYRNDYIGMNQIIVTFDMDGKPKTFNARAQKSAASFTTTWMRNIKDQQL